MNRYGSHRVIAPRGALPQGARQLDNTPRAHPNEILCNVELLNLDSASFAQMRGAFDDDAGRIADHILQTVAECGKQHNPVTGSGGMFVGCVAEIGEALTGHAVRPGDRIASLVSLTLTPLQLEAIDHVNLSTGQIAVRGRAILFESSAFAKLPDDLDPGVALAALDVAGAPAQMQRLVKAGMTVVVLGADGKSGMLVCAQARTQLGDTGRLIAVSPNSASAGARALTASGIVDEFVEADARDALALLSIISGHTADGADLVVNCVNVPGTEMGSILCAKDGGTVYFFSMNTSFTAAALGAEGAGKDVTMIIGNGFARDHAAIALQVLRDHPAVRTHFEKHYSAPRAERTPQ